MEFEESKRIHTDWWGKCHTCRWWPGPRERVLITQPQGLPRCGNEQSSLSRQGVSSAGYCEEWDSFDVDVALEIMEETRNAI